MPGGTTRAPTRTCRTSARSAARPPPRTSGPGGPCSTWAGRGRWPRSRTRPGPPLPGGDLSAEDARYLDWVVEDFLFDPHGAVRVRVRVPVAFDGLGLGDLTEDRDGWLVRGANGRPDRIHFTDGESLPAP